MATSSPAATIPELAAHLRVAVVRTSRRLRREAGGELSPTLAAALGTVGRHGPLTPSELADREGIRRPSATRLIARLEEAGLVTRASDPADGRSCLIAITPEAETLLDDLRTRKDAYLARRLRTLPAADRATLARAADLLESLLAAEEREGS
jgi:DNA-binding MarR family transcriptional regulator